MIETMFVNVSTGEVIVVVGYLQFGELIWLDWDGPDQVIHHEEWKEVGE